MSDKELTQDQLAALRDAGFVDFEEVEKGLTPEVRLELEALRKEFSLQAIREQLGVTQVDAAARMQITQSAFSKIERRREDMQIRTLKRYAKALGGRVDLLISFPGQPPVVFETDEKCELAHHA